MRVISRVARSGAHRRWAATVATLAVAAMAAGCTAPGTAPSSPSATAGSSSPSETPTPTIAPTHDPIAGMTLEQRVGQLFMVGTTATAAQQVTIDAITRRHVGNVFLSGRSYLGVTATAAVVARLRAAVNASSTGGTRLLVATDQEGGEVQVLHGAGFSTMPTALVQGTMTTPALRSSAVTWGSQLHAAGVNMDLGPVVDLVASAKAAPANPPIGAFHREFGFNAGTIEGHATAFRSGMTASKVLTVIKHFPGLGFVTRNTDTSSNVVDTLVGPTGVDISIYQNQIAGGVNSIMVSSAIYKRIDPTAPAVFSRTVVTGLLRNKLGFTGVIMTDDLSGATQVQAYTPGQRAILSIEAGVDIVLASRYPDVLAKMVDAVVTRARTDNAFAAKVDAAARRVVLLKSQL